MGIIFPFAKVDYLSHVITDNLSTKDIRYDLWFSLDTVHITKIVINPSLSPNLSLYIEMLYIAKTNCIS